MNYPAYIKNLYEAIDQQNINGARGIYDQIYAAVEKVLKGYLIRKNGRQWVETNGMDVLQCTSLKIWQLLKEKKYDLSAKSKFTSWCIGILLNKRKDCWRKMSSCKEVTADDFTYKSHADKSMQPDMECEQNEKLLLIMKEISKLPKMQKTIVMDKIMHKSGVDIAKELKITPVRVSRELNSARKALSKLLL